jgi:hypothetical protein
LILGLGITSCLLPALQLPGGRTLHGLPLLLAGWRRPFSVAWSANLVLGLGLLCLTARRYRWAALLGAAAALLGLTTATLAGPLRLLSGYYLWQASLILLVLGANVLAQRGRDG